MPKVGESESTGLFFNDINDYCCRWLRNLFPDGEVDGRRIEVLSKKDVSNYRRCHFFAGIAGRELALNMAQWSRNRVVWTGSCPCQPFSSAGKQHAESDRRHLWPEFFRLIAECRPPTIFGEQVASKLGREWIARVRTDLEALGYAVGIADLCAASVSSPHIRQRIYWVADATKYNSPQAYREGMERKTRAGSDFGYWAQFSRLQTSPSWRIKPGINPMVNGVRLNLSATHAYGNSIVPQVAATFIRSFMEAEVDYAQNR